MFGMEGLVTLCTLYKTYWYQELVFVSEYSLIYLLQIYSELFFFLSSSEKRLLQELEAAREARRAIERQREELVKKAKLMQNKTQNRRNHGRWL